MNAAARSGGGPTPEHTEDRLARLQRRLAEGPAAQLGLRAELRGETVLITAVVPNAACREELLAAIAAELAGVPVHTDITVADAGVPERPEALS